MKKILLCVPLLAIFAAGFFGCSQQRQWNHEQRKAMREALRSYRQMVYLDDLNDAEFVLFSDEVAGQLENSYPVYMEFVQMQGVDDTVDMVVVSTIVDELNADARNMRHLYPYEYLVEQDVLPTGLDREQQRAFLRDASRLLRESYMLHAGINEISYLWGEELAFCSKFAPFVGSQNIEPLIAEIECALAQISQNGNPTIVFTHFALSVSKMIKRL